MKLKRILSLLLVLVLVLGMMPTAFAAETGMRHLYRIGSDFDELFFLIDTECLTKTRARC